MTKGSSKHPTPASAPRPEPAKPRSVRDLGGPSDATLPDAAVQPERVPFEADGVAWTAQSMGASIGPRGTAPAPLLLIRFTRGREEGAASPPSGSSPRSPSSPRSDAAPPDLEPAAAAPDTEEPHAAQAWIAARSLSDVSVEQLVDALRTARPWSGSGGPRPFFGDIGGQRRR